MRDAAAKAGSDRIDGVARTWDEDDVAGVDEGQMNMTDAFLRADQRQHFVGRIKLDGEAALIPIRDRLSK